MSTRRVFTRKTKINVGKDVQKSEPWHLAGGNKVNTESPYGPREMETPLHMNLYT